MYALCTTCMLYALYILYVNRQCSMSTAQCSMSTAQCSMSTAQCSMTTAQCSMSTAQCSMSTAQCSVNCSMLYVNCSTLYVNCSMLCHQLCGATCRAGPPYISDLYITSARTIQLPDQKASRIHSTIVVVYTLAQLTCMIACEKCFGDSLYHSLEVLLSYNVHCTRIAYYLKSRPWTTAFLRSFSKMRWPLGLCPRPRWVKLQRSPIPPRPNWTGGTPPPAPSPGRRL